MNEQKAPPQIQLLTQSEASDSWVMMFPVKSSTVERAEKAGIALAGDIKERTGKAIVLRCSNGCAYVKPGDKVVHLMYAPAEVELDGNKFLMVQEKDIIGIYGNTNNETRQREAENENESTPKENVKSSAQGLANEKSDQQKGKV